MSHSAWPRFKGRESGSTLKGKVTKSLCTRTHGIGDTVAAIFGNSNLPLQATLFLASLYSFIPTLLIFTLLPFRKNLKTLRRWIGGHGNKTKEVGWCQVIISYRYSFIHSMSLFKTLTMGSTLEIYGGDVRWAKWTHILFSWSLSPVGEADI